MGCLVLIGFDWVGQVGVGLDSFGLAWLGCLVGVVVAMAVNTCAADMESDDHNCYCSWFSRRWLYFLAYLGLSSMTWESQKKAAIISSQGLRSALVFVTLARLIYS